MGKMALLNGLLLMTIARLASEAASDTVTDGTELVFAFMTHRHGDRTPIKTSLTQFGVNISSIEPFISPYGYGQLTDAGKRTGYKTGQFIRRRYNDIIAPKYNKSEMYIRSTDSTRTQMTVLAAMSAVYPAGKDNWSNDINWDPVPYTTVPAKYDFNIVTTNCPIFLEAMKALLISPATRVNMNPDAMNKISGFFTGGQKLANMPVTTVMLFGVYDVYVSLMSLGYDVEDEIKMIMPDISAWADEAVDIVWGNEDLIHMQAGVLLNEFFTYANKVIAGHDTPKVRIYSAHDLNVYSLEAVTRVRPRQGVPKYGSLFSLELRRVVETGQYVVLPVYLADPNEGVETYLEVEGCGSLLCDYDTFYSITSPYALDESTWRAKCGFTEDMIFDSSGID